MLLLQETPVDSGTETFQYKSFPGFRKSTAVKNSYLLFSLIQTSAI